MDLAVAAIRIKHDLKEKIQEIRQAVSVPPYVISSILSEIQNELKDEEKELLTVLLLQAEAKESEDNGENTVLHDNRESGQE